MPNHTLSNVGRGGTNKALNPRDAKRDLEIDVVEIQQQLTAQQTNNL
jgi:hypothetical protein